MDLIRRRKITIVERRGKFIVEYRDHNGKRPRPTFDTWDEANGHKLKMERVFAGYLAIKELDISLPGQTVLVDKTKTIKHAIKDFRLTARRIGNTGRVEKYHFEDLYLWLNNEKEIEKIHKVERIHLEEFRAKLLDGSLSWKKRGLSPSSVNRMFATYSSFFNKCIEWGLIAKNPIQGLKDLEELKPKIEPWTGQHVNFATNSKKLPLWARECLFFMAETGCRVIDLTRATWPDFDFEKRHVRFVSYKGGKTREDFHPMSDRLYSFMLGKYEAARRVFKAKDTDFVFLNQKGHPVTTERLGEIFRAVREELGLKGFALYGIRHGFIDGLVDLGVHPRDIQVLARHAKFETTTRYTHRNNEKLRPVVNRASDAKQLLVAEGV